MRAFQKAIVLLFAALLAAPLAASAQTLAEIAREAKKKKEESTRKVWTNDDLGTAFPDIKLLGKGQKPISLGAFEPTPLPIVEAMLRLADVQAGEVVFDLGSGDGRIVIMAAEKFSARGVGVEIDAELVTASRQIVEAKGLQEQVRIVHADAFDVDLEPADVVTLYVAPTILERLRAHMESTLRPGTRVVSHRHEIPGWAPERSLDLEGFWLYLYRVP